MCKLSTILACFLMLPWYLSAQILPEDSSVLNYRLIGFLFPRMEGANNYGLEIAEGNCADEVSFKEHRLMSRNSGSHKIIAEVPLFGSAYTWRIIYTINHTHTIFSKLHHFRTGTCPSVDTSKVRLRILKPAEEYKDAYVFVEANRALYDMYGRAVWFLPDVGGQTGEYPVRDLKMTPQSTITFIGLDEGYEINYNGELLWKAPYTGTVHYHHEMTRLTNGHYMILSTEMADEYISDSTYNKSGLVVLDSNDAASVDIRIHPDWKFNKKQAYPKVIEYDSSGKVVWQYRSSVYFNRSDLFFRRNEDGSLNTKVHDNGFFLDEQHKQLYISCKDISRIIKVSYPGGNTIDAYGEKFTPGATQNRGKGFFCGQHNCQLTEAGNLTVLNNNSCHPHATPTVLIMKQPSSITDSLKKIWEYTCTIDDMPEEEKNKIDFQSGGSAYELPDHSIFVDMAGQYSKLFIVNADKKILWSALPEKWQTDMGKWVPFPQYRASIITNREDLEKLIWGTEK